MSQFVIPGGYWLDDNEPTDRQCDFALAGAQWVDASGVPSSGIVGIATVDPFSQTVTLSAPLVNSFPGEHEYLIPGFDWFDDGVTGEFLIPGFVWVYGVGTSLLAATQTVDPFTQTVILTSAGTASIAATQALDPFTQSVTLAALDKINGSSTVDPFTQTAALTTLRKINGSSTVAPFTQTVTLFIPGERLTKLVSYTILKTATGLFVNQTIDPFTQTATLTSPHKINGSSTVAPFTQTATLTVLDEITVAQTMDAFIQDVEFIHPVVRASKLIGYSVLAQDRMLTTKIVGYAVLRVPIRHIITDQLIDPFTQAVTLDVFERIVVDHSLGDFNNRIILQVKDGARPRLASTAPYDPVPLFMTDWRPWLQRIARATNTILAGGQNTTTAITLNTRSTTTTLTDSRIGATSFINLVPLTKTAMAEIWWIESQSQGRALIRHSNSPVGDRSFRVIIIG